MEKFSALLVTLLLVTACADSPGTSDPTLPTDPGDAGPPPAPDAAVDPPPADDPVRPEWTPAEPRGRVYVGNYLSPFQVAGFDTESLASFPAEPRDVGRPTGDVVGIPALGVVAVTMEGHGEIEVYDADSLAPIAGSPYATGWGAVAIAHDDAIHRLYVYCIGTRGDYERSLLTVYDTSAVPYVEVEGSPFHIDVPANRIVVDHVTGRLVGHSISHVWMAEVDETGVTQVEGSPLEVEGTPNGLVVDPARRRFYFSERVFGLEQELRAFDLDDFTEIAGSPVVFPGRSVGSVALHPESGAIFAVDYVEQRLHAFQAEPFAALSACGTPAGCEIPPTETGLALDHARDRLFITHVPSRSDPDGGYGFLTAWDVSDPASPVEVTVPGERPRLGFFPNRATIY